MWPSFKCFKYSVLRIESIRKKFQFYIQIFFTTLTYTVSLRETNNSWLIIFRKCHVIYILGYNVLPSGLKIINENPKNEQFLWLNLWIFLSGVNISHHPASFIPEAEHSLCSSIWTVELSIWHLLINRLFFPLSYQLLLYHSMFK